MTSEDVAIEAAGGGGTLSPPGIATWHLQQLYHRSFALAGIGTWHCELADQSLTWSEGVYDLFGLPRGSPIGREQAVAHYAPESRCEMEGLRARAIACGASFTMEARIATVEGEERWMRLIADIEREKGRPIRLFGLKQDITQERFARARLRRLAERDPLTGLANRLLFQTRLNDACAEAARQPATLLLIDLDRFKTINDRFGHLAGDACLRATATRLRRTFPEATALARLGGDEFAVLLGGADARRQACALADRFLHAMRREIRWRSLTLSIGASVGIATSTPGFAPATTLLLADADAALYEAKRSGRGRAIAAAEALAATERRRA